MNPVTFPGAFSDERVRRAGKLFELADYPDKGFSLTETEADAAFADFEPVPLELERFLSQGKASILDGQMGEIARVWREGKTLFVEATVPPLDRRGAGEARTQGLRRVRPSIEEIPARGARDRASDQIRADGLTPRRRLRRFQFHTGPIKSSYAPVSAWGGNLVSIPYWSD